MAEDAHPYDDAWTRFCEAEDEYLVFLEVPSPPELDSKRVEAIKSERFGSVCHTLYAYHEAHPHLSQVQLEDRLRENNRRTYLIAGASREKLTRVGMTLSFGEQATRDLDRELCLHTMRTRDDYQTCLKEYGHCTEEKNRRLIAHAGFVRLSSPARREVEKSGGNDPDKTCASCQSSGLRMKHCARCKLAYYCSEECQRADWKRHRPECKCRDPETRK